MRTYEVMFILRPDIPDDEADKLVASMHTVATNAGANVHKTERMGKRRLAYRVRGFRDGNYVLFGMEAEAGPVHELQRRLRVSEPVIKHLIVRTDELERRFQKDRRHREERAKRKPVAQAAAPALAAVPAAEAADPAPIESPAPKAE